MRAAVRIGLWLVLALSAALTGCGGGGGGGGSPGGSGGGSNFSVSANKTSVSLSFEQGSTTGISTSIIVTISGTYSGTLYVGAEADGQGIAPYIPLSILSDTQGRFDVYAANGLQAGTYTGKIYLYACSDPGCNNPVGGTPIVVPYTVEVLPTLGVTPAAPTISVQSGQTGSAMLNVTLPNGTSSFSAAITQGSAWLELGNMTSTSLTINTRAWRSGTYSGSILITAGSKSVNVPVTYVVTAPPGGEHDLQTSPTGISFAAAEGAAATPQTLAITLPTWGSANDVQIDIEYTSGTGWLSATRTSNGATVGATATALVKGVYSAKLRITPSVPGTAVVVPVTLTVGDGLVQPANHSLSITGDTTAGALSGAVTVNSNGIPMNWTAASSAPWLTLTRAAGSTGSDIEFSINQSAVESWENFGSRSATVTITSALPNVSPRQFLVAVTKTVPEVQFLGPYLVIPGKETLLHVRGRGFTSVASLAARVGFSGLGTSNLTLIDDKHFTVRINPTSPASHAISVSNALTMPAASATLRVLAPQNYPDAVIPSAGKKRAVIFDPERQTVFAANNGTGELNRFRFNGTTWQSDSISVPTIVDTGMGPDGNSLIVTATSTGLSLLNPASLATTFSVSVGVASLSSISGTGIATTNDGRSWLATGSTWNDLVYFDHATHSIQPMPLQTFSTTFYGGPWMVASRNGERMVVNQSAGITPQPPMLYQNTAEGLLKIAPGNPGVSYQMFLSDDGDRAMFGAFQVRDGAFGLIGDMPLTDGYWGYAGALSPDGRRAYLLAYPQTWPYPGPQQGLPRLYVLDTSVAAGGQTTIPLLGYKTLTAYPTCTDSSYTCYPRSHTAISPDGNTLFFIGDQNLIVTSTAESGLTPLTNTSKTKAAGIRTRAWQIGNGNKQPALPH